MKCITPAILTAFSALALSFASTAFADNTDSDGFIVFEAAEVSIAATTTQASNSAVTNRAQRAVKKAKNKSRKRAKRAQRKVRKKRNTRVTRAQRNNNRRSIRRASIYKVRKGDTLYRISVKSGVKLSRLIRLNKLHGSKKHNIQAGQRIRLR